MLVRSENSPHGYARYSDDDKLQNSRNRYKMTLEWKIARAFALDNPA
jgi:hypothetical protein